MSNAIECSVLAAFDTGAGICQAAKPGPGFLDSDAGSPYDGVRHRPNCRARLFTTPQTCHSFRDSLFVFYREAGPRAWRPIHACGWYVARAVLHGRSGSWAVSAARLRDGPIGSRHARSAASVPGTGFLVTSRRLPCPTGRDFQDSALNPKSKPTPDRKGRIPSWRTNFTEK
jgi:hypothetical protein